MAAKRKKQLKKRHKHHSRNLGLARRLREVEDGDDLNYSKRERVRRAGDLFTPEDGFDPHQVPGDAVPGVVVRVLGKVCEVRSEAGEIIRSEIRGAVRDFATHERRLAAVGDRVLYTALPDGTGLIYDLGERETTLSRPDHFDPSIEHIIAANAERLAVVSSVDEPLFRPGLVDRYLIAAAVGGLEPFIIVNKMDLAPEGFADLLGPYRALDAHVIFASAKTGLGVDEVRSALAGRATLVVGQSGVGKSAILNAVQPGLGLKVGQISVDRGKGRHTTSTAWMLDLESGGQVIDTPGVRAFGLWGVDRPNLQHYLKEFAPFLNECRLPGCVHIHEPDCAVKRAVEAGDIPEVRYESYCAIYESLPHEPLHQN